MKRARRLKFKSISQHAMAKAGEAISTSKFYFKNNAKGSLSSELSDVPHRPTLREIPLAAVTLAPGQSVITIDVGAWDPLIAAAWRCGWILVEMRDDQPVRAFQQGHLS